MIDDDDERAKLAKRINIQPKESRACMLTLHATTIILQNVKKHLKGQYDITIKRALNKTQIAINKQLKQLY
jgi:hypothetical protein